MAMYYYAWKLTAACSSGESNSPSLSPPLLSRHRPVATISHQPGPSHYSDKMCVVGSPVMKSSAGNSLNPAPAAPEPSTASPALRPKEPIKTEDMLYRDGNLISGQLEALVEHLVPTSDYYPDRAFLFAFLLTSRLFIKPHELLGRVSERCQADMIGANKGTEPSSHLVRLIAEWSETFPYDFRDERVMSHVREVAHKCVTVEDSVGGTEEVREEVSLILHNLLDKLTRLEQYEAFLHSIRKESITFNISKLSQTETDELCGSAESLAQQLTHIELERLSYIAPEEFVQVFNKENSIVDEPRITTNCEVYQEWATRLSRLVATDICRHVKSRKQRLRVVEFWVETARECFNIGNFNSLMSIVAGFNMPSTVRLKRTWKRAEYEERLTILEKQMSCDDNYSSYRSLLKAAAGRFNKDNPSLCIVIPIFTLLTKEIHAHCQECLVRLPNGHINFEKVWQLAKQVTEFITWKQVHFPFPKSAKVITYLQATPVLNEEGALLASFECEPPETTEERELQFKLLSSNSRCDSTD